MQTNEPNTPKLVNKREIARRYGVSERTIQDWMENTMIPVYKLGYMVRFDPIECDKALTRFRVPKEHLAPDKVEMQRRISE